MSLLSRFKKQFVSLARPVPLGFDLYVHIKTLITKGNHGSCHRLPLKHFSTSVIKHLHKERESLVFCNDVASMIFIQSQHFYVQLNIPYTMSPYRVEHPRVVLRKGHIGVSFYFIFSGSVFVNVEELLTKTGHVMWHTAITLHRGDCFGVSLNILNDV